jgi:hypothetical protein
MRRQKKKRFAIKNVLPMCSLYKEHHTSDQSQGLVIIDKLQKSVVLIVKHQYVGTPGKEQE